ncbi:RING-H2 finger protein ATL8-like [Telopea speciosissima]|uniref:RING-H2 finger protein ATL8-like n=1 Tax=Telopea speciosissima TaxID=54955 RepID=UPI001CC52ED8|nr:RING-H2 finger protein ATL8-like [Telopea speciosissima]
MAPLPLAPVSAPGGYPETHKTPNLSPLPIAPLRPNLSLSVFLFLVWSTERLTMPLRYLTGINSSSSSSTSSAVVAEPPVSVNVDSDFVVILAALLCALICVVGLVAVARCAWLRRASDSSAGTGRSQPRASANKGLKKKIFRSLPKLTFNADVNGKLADCPICLTDFVDGDEIRVLPQCGHTFHVGCIDTWLGSHSSCPSCRQILVVAMCQKCGGLPATSAVGVNTESGLKAREDDVNRFLP